MPAGSTGASAANPTRRAPGSRRTPRAPPRRRPGSAGARSRRSPPSARSRGRSRTACCATARRPPPASTSPGSSRGPGGSRAWSISSSSGRRPPRAKMNTATATTTIASVVSMNGAPRIAPIPMSSPAACPDTIAMIGRSVSGSAVPTAASTEPTAPSDRPKPSPTHSTPFVNSSAPAKITSSETTSKTQSIWLGMLPGLLGSPQAMTTPPAAARSDRDVRIRLALGAALAHRAAGALGPVDRVRICRTASKPCCSVSRSSAPRSSCRGRPRLRSSTSRPGWRSPCSR